MLQPGGEVAHTGRRQRALRRIDAAGGCNVADHMVRSHVLALCCTHNRTPQTRERHAPSEWLVVLNRCAQHARAGHPPPSCHLGRGGRGGIDGGQPRGRPRGPVDPRAPRDEERSPCWCRPRSSSSRDRRRPPARSRSQGSGATGPWSPPAHQEGLPPVPRYQARCPPGGRAQPGGCFEETGPAGAYGGA